MIVVGLLYGVWFDLDFDNHFGLSDILLILLTIASLAAAGKVVNTSVLYLRHKQQERFASAVFEAVRPKLDVIQSQLEPNSGLSLHDKITTATARISVLEGGQKEILAVLDTIKDNQNAIETRRVDLLREEVID